MQKNNTQSYFRNNDLDNLLKHSALLIFDMNGLIVDDESVQIKAIAEVLKDFGIKIKKENWIKNYTGRRALDFFPEIMQENNIKNYSVEQIIKKKNEIYHSIIQKKIHSLIRPGVEALINYAMPEKKIALATSASRDEVEIILGKKGLSIKNKFDYILCGDDISKAKPEPEIYLAVSKKAEIAPDKALVFEDSCMGVDSAFYAGMKCIACPNEYTKNKDFRNATYVVDNLTRDAKIMR